MPKPKLACGRLAPGAIIPAHSHAHEEECLVLSGSIQYAGRTLYTGDFLGAAIGEHQSAIISPEGAMLLIRSELRLG
jgi:quercetin dioxygenase-like cupin family protein